MLLALLGLGCAEAEPARPSLRRLVDELALGAVVDFPAFEPLAVSGMQVISLQDLEWQAEDYRGDDVDGPSPVTAGVTDDVYRIAPPGLFVETREPSPACLVSPWVHVLPSTGYDFMGAVRTEDLESTTAARGTFLVEERSPEGIERHRLPSRYLPTTDWELLTLHFVSRPATEKVRVLACLAAPGEGTGRAFFDEVALVRTGLAPLTPEVAEQIAERRLSFAWRHDAAEAGRPELGADRAWAPDPELDRFRRKFDLAGDVRSALVAPPATTYRFPLDGGADRRLRFAIGIANPGGARVPGSVEFRVGFVGDAGAAEEGGGALETDTLFERALRLDARGDGAPGGRWHPVEIALPDAPGELVLSTRSTGGLALASAAIANPTIVAGEARGAGRLAIVVSLDTLRADALGVYGAERPTSPHLDALAKRGVVFDMAHAASSWTLPSHRTMLTGLRPLTHGALIGERHSIRSEITTLGERLQDEGFVTVGIHGGGFVSPAYGFAEGFDRYVQIEEPRDAVDEALRAIDAHRDQDLFLFLHSYQAHDPYLPFEDELTALGPRFAELRDRLAGVVTPRELGSHLFLKQQNASETPLPDDQRELLRLLYEAGVRRVDEQIGRLVAELEKRERLADSVWIVTSDHGDGFEEHGHLLHSNSLYWETIRVPLLVVAPGRVPAGQRVAAHAATADVVPTLMELLSLDAPEGIEGRSLVPTWASPDDPPAPVDGSLVQDLHVLLYTVADGRKYIVGTRGPREELYDLRTDPEERDDLAPSSPELLAAYRERVAPRIARLPGLHVVVVAPPGDPTASLVGAIGAPPETPMRVFYLPCEKCGVELRERDMFVRFPLTGSPLWLNLPFSRSLDEVPIDLAIDGQPLRFRSLEDLLAVGLAPGAYAFVVEGEEAPTTQLSPEQRQQLEALGYLD